MGMVRVDLEQRSPEWLAWREGKITATMAGVIVGNSVSKQTPLSLWEELTGRKEATPPNEFLQRIMDRGSALEPEARDRYVWMSGNSVKDCCVQHDEHDWAAASLDGITDDNGIVGELKCPISQQKHVQAIDGEMPDMYRAQVQWQLFVTNALEAHFFSYAPDHEQKEAVVVVLPDREYQAWLFEQCQAFRDCLLEDRPPESVKRGRKKSAA